jgi:translation initiation factor IF-2
MRSMQEDTTIRPNTLKVRLPITIKDLASEMKLKASQLVQKLFLQGVVATLNDLLEDETTVQLLGTEFGCDITIDTAEEERLRITGKTIIEEIKSSNQDELTIRPPVVAFMGHVDHGKTSLIDAIRKSNRAAGEAGAITQHIGAFRCSTPVGDIAILDTPGHEAFSAMRARGADVTDIVVLVIAGDEGIRQQTIEAIQHAKEAKVTICVALNKCDKPNFNAENVYRQLSDHELLPEAWGGQTITVNCSAATGEGIPQLLEMLALQAEVLELKANPKMRARGTVLESEMNKGVGAKATVLVQNGTLHVGDALVFTDSWCRVKTMHDEYGVYFTDAGPSTPVEITGLSGVPEAGEEFIVVKNEKEARSIAEARREGVRQFALQQKKKVSMENLMLKASESPKKILNLVLRADVQGSLEALKTALQKIKSEKAEINILFGGVGEVTESDVQLAAISKAVIIGFHTAIESHADSLVKQMAVQVKLHDIIYHAVDDVKDMMVNLLDKIAQENEKGKAIVKTLFKSSQVGTIAGCGVTEGTIARNNQIRVKRGNEVIWKGGIASLRRVKDDVKEVQKGLECGISLQGFSGLQENDILEAYEIIYITQEL